MNTAARIQRHRPIEWPEQRLADLSGQREQAKLAAVLVLERRFDLRADTACNDERTCAQSRWQRLHTVARGFITGFAVVERICRHLGARESRARSRGNGRAASDGRLLVALVRKGAARENDRANRLTRLAVRRGRDTHAADPAALWIRDARHRRGNRQRRNQGADVARGAPFAFRLAASFGARPSRQRAEALTGASR